MSSSMMTAASGRSAIDSGSGAGIKQRITLSDEPGCACRRSTDDMRGQRQPRKVGLAGMPTPGLPSAACGAASAERRLDDADVCAVRSVGRRSRHARRRETRGLGSDALALAIVPKLSNQGAPAARSSGTSARARQGRNRAPIEAASVLGVYVIAKR